MQFRDKDEEWDYEDSEMNEPERFDEVDAHSFIFNEEDCEWCGVVACSNHCSMCGEPRYQH